MTDANKVKGMFTDSEPVTVTNLVTVMFYHCAYGDGLSDGQNGCGSHSACKMARHIGTMMSL